MKHQVNTMLVLACCGHAAWGQYRLVELQPVPGGLESIATSIDDQGRVVGSSRNASGARLAVLWPAADQPPIVLGVLDGGTESEATGVVNGRVLGFGPRACGERGAFEWTESVGLRPIGPDGCPDTQAIGLNGRGEALLSVGQPAFPMVWPIDAGSPRFLETWEEPASVFHIDERGVVVGSSAFHPSAGGRTRAIEWRADGTARLLPRLDPAAGGFDAAVSSNTRGTIVGQARLGDRSRAAVWQPTGEVINAAEALGEGVTSSLLSINASDQAVGFSSLGAILWDPGSGAVLLESIVDDSGDGWELVQALDINDGGVIVGNGLDPDGQSRGFALFEGGGGCPADLDGDGELTIFDFLAFQNLFDSGDPRADFDGDGLLTIFDFLAFQNAFDAGC
ncbi:MAG: GC-type dockerin domain-anchored protein [Phycisphaerales bacterium]